MDKVIGQVLKENLRQLESKAEPPMKTQPDSEVVLRYARYRKSINLIYNTF